MIGFWNLCASFLLLFTSEKNRPIALSGISISTINQAKPFIPAYYSLGGINFHPHQPPFEAAFSAGF